MSATLAGSFHPMHLPATALRPHVLALLQLHAGCWVSTEAGERALECARGWDDAYRVLEDLRREGSVERIGGEGCYWRVRGEG